MTDGIRKSDYLGRCVNEAKGERPIHGFQFAINASMMEGRLVGFQMFPLLVSSAA